MPYYMYGSDYSYLLFILPAMAVALISQINIKRTFRKYSRVGNQRNITGAAAASEILRRNGIAHIRVERVAGQLSDHYDPKAGVIRLSDGVFGSPSVAAVGVAAHEAGHAVQYAEGYGPIKLRNAVIPVTRFGSTLSMPLILAGYLFSFPALVLAGIILFSAMVFFQLITLPVEFNASTRAVRALEEGGTLSDEELSQAKKVLRAAAMTYVAALLVSAMQLLRLFLMFSGRKKN